MAPSARYEITKNRKGEFKFTLVAANNKVLVESEYYTTKDACKKGIEALQKIAVSAEIKELLD
ncbi:MAG: YegP family protein [Clostridiales bacterium]|jgi:uncharacterized protein YegP (UPF0339 family)|nr:YegP family protein [Clostridiales bacterium]